MARRLKKLFLAVLAVALVITNTDIAIGAVIALVPGTARWKVFFILVVVANIQAVIWYRLGYALVEVLADCYGSLVRWARMPNIPRSLSFLLGWGMSALRPFHDWEETRLKVKSSLESFVRSKKGMIGTLFSWLVIPGSRSFTAILLGMESWRGGLAALLIVNTLHIALSFWFFKFVRDALASIYHFVIAF